MKKLPREDYVKVKPIRRGKKQLRTAAILKALSIIHWDLVVAEGPSVVELALERANYHGYRWHVLTPRGDGSLVDYCEFVIAAARREKVINDVEYALWLSNPCDDPRLIEFRRGFIAAKKDAEKAAKTKNARKRKRKP